MKIFIYLIKMFCIVALVGAPFDEIIVESNLNVRKKPEPARRKTRSLILTVIHPEHTRYSKSNDLINMFTKL